jgi:3-phenylpropionate/cinnamic acid dioxygenase small subunit
MKFASKANNAVKRLAIPLLTAVILAAGTTVAYAQTTGKSWELTEHQKGILGPTKLTMTEADYSGAVNSDPKWMADRLAILNLMTAYSYLIDEGRWDQWYELFAKDVLFESTVPCFGTIQVKGRDGFKALTDLRYLAGGKTTTMRRHTMGNVHVAEQTATTAKVRSYMLISSVPASDTLKMLTTGTYNADMQKRDGKWIITRWYIEVDAPVAQSPMPANLPADVIKFTPDKRTECEKK